MTKREKSNEEIATEQLRVAMVNCLTADLVEKMHDYSMQDYFFEIFRDGFSGFNSWDNDDLRKRIIEKLGFCGDTDEELYEFCLVGKH